jgi:adenylate kinase|tara:strand:+ start:59007 stop:59615 length:609 start_codon:yes stop_codon:yes gene_type:complete
MGIPGSGKSSQAKLLEDQLKLKKISTGDLLREEIKKGTTLGNKIKELIDPGNLAPDDIIDEILKKKIKKIKDNFILDGYPRNLSQTKYLDKIIKIDKVFLFKIPEKIIIKRLSNRRQCTKCKRNYNLISKKPKKHSICDYDKSRLIQREDDKPKTIKHRLKVYKKEISPILNFYKEKNILIIVNAEKSPNEIFKIIKNKLYK